MLPVCLMRTSKVVVSEICTGNERRKYCEFVPFTLLCGAGPYPTPHLGKDIRFHFSTGVAQQLLDGGSM